MRRWVAGAAAVAGVYMLVQMWPDFVRYMRIRSM